MKIYFGHSKVDGFEEKYYNPIKGNLEKYGIVLPHDIDHNAYQGREFYKTIDIFIAEVSAPATGLGIELGYADDDKTSIYCIYKKGTKPSGSLRTITNNFYEYEDTSDMIRIIEEIICQNYQK
jgi:hypothetical protein